MELKGSWNNILPIFSLIWILNTLWKLIWKVLAFFYNAKRNFILFDSKIFYNRKCSHFTKLNKISNSLSRIFFFCQSTYLSLIELLTQTSLGIRSSLSKPLGIFWIQVPWIYEPKRKLVSAHLLCLLNLSEPRSYS